MDTKHTPGNWQRGKTGGTVVTDQPLPGYCGVGGGHDAVEYYGGYLIAESIWREEDVRLIAAAPDLLAALDRLAHVAKLLGADQDEGGALSQAYAAIAKATGVRS